MIKKRGMFGKRCSRSMEWIIVRNNTILPIMIMAVAALTCLLNTTKYIVDSMDTKK
jgi:hypothetical protein